VVSGFDILHQPIIEFLLDWGKGFHRKLLGIEQSIFGVAESEYEFVILMSRDRPLNPPILGNFPFSVPPKVGGLGGQKTISISNGQFFSILGQKLIF
jgi:hypothetical protein